MLNLSASSTNRLTGGKRTADHLNFLFVNFRQVLDNVKQFSVGEIACLVKDGYGSKLIIDGILDSRNEKVRSHGSEFLLDALKSDLVGVSSHRIGHWTVEKIFNRVSFKRKMEICDQLSSGMRRLEGCSSGRAVISQCHVEAYLQGKSNFTDAVNKAKRLGSFVGEVARDGGGSGKASEGASGEKKKRKRKKRRGGEDLGGDSGGDSGGKGQNSANDKGRAMGNSNVEGKGSDDRTTKRAKGEDLLMDIIGSAADKEDGGVGKKKEKKEKKEKKDKKEKKEKKKKKKKLSS